MNVLASDLRGKTVMSDEGLLLGRLRNLTIHPKSGELKQLLVEPGDDVDPTLFKRDPRGYLVFDVANLRNVRDVILVSTA